MPQNTTVAKVKKKKARISKRERCNDKGWMDGKRQQAVEPLLPAYFNAVERSWQEAAKEMKKIQGLFHFHFPWPMKD